MSLAQEIRAILLLADYAAADASGKLNILGGGWQIANLLARGMTGPQHLLAIIDVPSRYLGEEFAISLSLFDELSGTVVRIAPPPAPGAAPQEDAEKQAMRVQQLVKAEKPDVPGVRLPPDFPGRIQTVLGFPDGLPLPPNGQFSWRLEVDGTHLKHWRAHFITTGPPPPPVIG